MFVDIKLHTRWKCYHNLRSGELHCSVSGDALFSMGSLLTASADQLADWNLNIVNPCTWSKIICNSNSEVTSVYVALKMYHLINI